MKQNSPINGKGGFTLIEIMIVIAIIGILAAIAIPTFISHKQKGYDASANSDIKNAYSAAQAYFQENNNGTVTQAVLANQGFRSTTGVTLTIINGSSSGLSMSTAHPSGSKIFIVNSAGKISF